jgi:hypothetical protein
MSTNRPQRWFEQSQKHAVCAADLPRFAYPGRSNPLRGLFRLCRRRVGRADLSAAEVHGEWGVDRSRVRAGRCEFFVSVLPPSRPTRQTVTCTSCPIAALTSWSTANGIVHQLVSANSMCRHTDGLNRTGSGSSTSAVASCRCSTTHADGREPASRGCWLRCRSPITDPQPDPGWWRPRTVLPGLRSESDVDISGRSIRVRSVRR